MGVQGLQNMDRRTGAAPQAGPAEKRRAAGFSLLELLTVLFLLGLIAGIAAPATSRFLDNLAFRKQTASILATLRYARLQSVAKGETVYVTTDAEHGRALMLSGAVEETKQLGLDEDAYCTMDPAVMAFYPEGYATPGLLTSVKGERSRRIALDPLTGLPIID